MTRLREGTSIFCMGDIMPDVIIPYGQAKQAQAALRQGKVVGCNPTLRPGGAVGNTTAVLGKLGAAPYFLGGTGSDEYGDYLCDYLRGCGVHTEYLFRQKEHTSLMLAVLDADGDRSIFSFNGPNAKLPQLEPQHLPQSLIPKIGWLHTNGFANDAMIDFFAQCAARGVLCSFDLNLRCETYGLDAARRARVLRAVEASAVVFGSGAEEFAPLTGISDLHRAAGSLATEKRIVVARDGANPVHLFADGTSAVIPVPSVRVVNSVGGGDAFNAGFIAAYASGRSAAEAVRWGNCCAGFAIASDRPHDVPNAAVIERAVAATE